MHLLAIAAVGGSTRKERRSLSSWPIGCSVALEIVHENQYGFVNGKTIQDCLGWAFEFLHQ
jgi:hypothetical protein